MTANSDLRVLMMIGVMALVTYLLRAFPFLLFGAAKQPPKLVLYLGNVISPAAIAMLVVYCVRHVPVTSWPHGLPELIAGGLVVGLHLAWRNPLLSICGGTAAYMTLVQTCFA